MRSCESGCSAAGEARRSSAAAARYLGSLAEKTGLMDTVAVCDVSNDRAEWGASRMRDATAYADFDAFTRHGLDAAIVGHAALRPRRAGGRASGAGHRRPLRGHAGDEPGRGRSARAAVERTRGFYMLAENYTFIDDVELVKRMADDGRFGRISFGEGEYLHDCRDLAFQADGTPTWRGQAPRRAGLYCTHSLGPLLYITDDRIATVSCLAADDGQEGDADGHAVEHVDAHEVEGGEDAQGSAGHRLASASQHGLLFHPGRRGLLRELAGPGRRAEGVAGRRARALALQA